MASIRETFEETFKEYRNLPRPVWAIAGSRIVNAVGSFVFPFITLFMTDRLEFNEEEAGRILMMMGAMFVPGSLIGGWVADRVGRKKLLVLALTAAGCSLAVAGFLPFTRKIIWFIFAQQFFFGLMMPASSAVTYDLTNPENRKTAFSLLYLAWNLGFAIGPIVAGLLYESHTRLLFLGDAATTFLSLPLLLLYLPETKPSSAAAAAKSQPTRRRHAAAGEAAASGSAFRLLLQRPVLLSFVLLMIVPWFIYAQHFFTLPIFVKEIFPARGAALYGSIMSANALIVVFFTVPLVRLTKRILPIGNVALHCLLYAVGFGMLFYFRSPAAFFISVLIWTSGEILGATNIEVFTAGHTPASHRGRFTSILPLIAGAGRGTAPWLTGMFLLTRPTGSVWAACFALGAAAAALFLVLGVFDRRSAP